MPGSTRLGTVAIGLRTANARAAVIRMVIRVVLIAIAGILVALGVVLLLASAIVRRNQDLKMIMDNVGQGFLTVRQDGQVLPEHSAILETWFGPGATTSRSGAYLASWRRMRGRPWKACGATSSPTSCPSRFRWGSCPPASAAAAGTSIWPTARS